MDANQLRLKRERKQAKRDEKKAQKLAVLAEKRVQQRGAPDFGITQSELLQMKIQVADLVTSNNMLVAKIEELDKINVLEKATEAHYMLQMILQILVKKGLVDHDELQKLSEEIQGEALGIEDKPEGSACEFNDIMLMKFKIFDGEKLIDEQMQAPLAYTVGSGGLGCDEALLGMLPGETRAVDAVFGEGFKFKEYAGKPLRMVLTCVGLKVKTTQKQKVQEVQNEQELSSTAVMAGQDGGV